MPPPLILASSSPFRRELLSRLRLPFECVSPDCDETPLAKESPRDTALRLAESKARSLAGDFPRALIIGSDQVLWAGARQWGKPLRLDRARETLRALSGQTLCFYTALVLLNSAENRLYRHVDETYVTMRDLNDEIIESYLRREPDALHCAGAAKSEGLGMTLLQSIESSDPNALIGLPMLRLIDFLLAEGVSL